MCAIRSWTEESSSFSSRCLLTNRAGAECCRQVGRNARPVTQMAAELGVCWDTVMAAVREHGEPLVDDPRRVGDVAALGVDETTWLTATKDHPTLFATGLVDLERRVVIDVIEGNSARDLGSWLDRQPPRWLGLIRVVATDLAESYRAGLAGRLDHAIRVADPFHVVRVANRCLDQVRRRVQNQTTGHRGRKRDPLYRIRKLMLTGAERLDGAGVDRMLLGMRAGDPEDEVLGAWLAKESVRDVYITEDQADAGLLLDKAIQGCRLDEVPEIRSLGRTLARWRTEILNHHTTGASNGPTEGLNLLVKKVKRAGHGFRSFANCRLRILLHAGGVDWPASRPPAPRIRSRSPH
jgi:transposase